MPKFTEKSSIINAKKFLKKIKKYNVQNIVLNRDLNKNNDFKKILFEAKKYVITGNRIGKILLPKIIDEVSTYAKIHKEKLKIALLMNEYSIENIDLIECISKDIKQLTIISKNYTKYEKTANKLYQNYGYMIKLYNSDVKELKKENLIINMDYTGEMLKNIILPRNGIIVSLNENIEYLRKNFNGIIINDVDILGNGMPKESFRKLAVCEAKIYKPLRKIKDNEKIFINEKYVINGYIGRNGKITQEDFERIGKNYA